MPFWTPLPLLSPLPCHLKFFFSFRESPGCRAVRHLLRFVKSPNRGATLSRRYATRPKRNAWEVCAQPTTRATITGGSTSPLSRTNRKKKTLSRTEKKENKRTPKSCGIYAKQRFFLSALLSSTLNKKCFFSLLVFFSRCGSEFGVGRLSFFFSSPVFC